MKKTSEFTVKSSKMKGKYQKKKENTWETQKTKKKQKTKKNPKLTSRPLKDDTHPVSSRFSTKLQYLALGGGENLHEGP